MGNHDQMIMILIFYKHTLSSMVKIFSCNCGLALLVYFLINSQGHLRTCKVCWWSKTTDQRSVAGNCSTWDSNLYSRCGWHVVICRDIQTTRPLHVTACSNKSGLYSSYNDIWEIISITFSMISRLATEILNLG